MMSKCVWDIVRDCNELSAASGQNEEAENVHLYPHMLVL